MNVGPASLEPVRRSFFSKKLGAMTLSWAAANYLATNFVHMPMDGAVVWL